MSSLFLLNPGSGKRKDIASISETIRQIYQEADQEVFVEEINFDTLSMTLQHAEQRGVRRVFAVGGDGTVNAVGSRLIDTSMHFGIIPLGSGNGYARNLGISVKTQLAIRQTLDAKTLLADTGVFADQPFLNVAGFGLDSEVAKNFALREKRGFRPYAISTFQAVRSLKPQKIELIIDGVQHEFRDVFGVVIALGGQWGYDAKVGRNVSLTDGLFDILVVRAFPFIQAGLMVSRMFNGTLKGSRNIIPFQGKEVSITREFPGSIQIDGEPGQFGEVLNARIIPQNLHILVPNTLSQTKISRL